MNHAEQEAVLSATSANDEWEIMHLTPTGWMDGSYRHEPGEAVAIAPPADDVLTVRRHASTAGRPAWSRTRTPRTEHGAD